MEDGYIRVHIDGVEILGREGQTIAEVAREHHVPLPTLCDFKSLRPAGTCRICTVKVGGRFLPGCSTAIAHGMVIENDTPELTDLRKALIEALLVEGNHMCPVCEKSGACELQELAYRHRILAPRFPFLFPQRKVDASMPHLLIEHNRCIQCLRCVRGVKGRDGEDLFGFTHRGRDIRVAIDKSHPDALTEETAARAAQICPVGALIKKRSGFRVPIGRRRFEREHAAAAAASPPPGDRR